MSRPSIEAFHFDDVNEDKMWEHGLRPAEVDQVLDNDHIVIRNRRGRVAVWLVTGRNNGGRCIVPTHAQ